MTEAEHASRLREERWLMIYGTLMILAVVFGGLALFWIGGGMVVAGRWHHGLIPTLALTVAFGCWTIFNCIQLVVRPTRRAAWIVLLLAFVTFVPTLIALEIS